MSYFIAARHYPAARLGEPPPGPQSQPQIPRDVRERYERELRNAINSNAVVQAIRRLPEGRVCPAPEHMAAHEQKIREKLRGSFHFSQLETGINLWRQSIGYAPNPDPFRQPAHPPQTSIKSIDPGERQRSVNYTARQLEQDYVLAQKTGDLEGMVKAAEAYYRLLGDVPPHGPGAPMQGRGSMELDRNRWLEAREDLLRQAPNLARIVRQLGPLDQHRLRQHLRPTVIQRSQPQRARRR
jgi:hypothetical protein